MTVFSNKELEAFILERIKTASGGYLEALEDVLCEMYGGHESAKWREWMTKENWYCEK